MFLEWRNDMYRYKCLNPIAAIGLNKFNDNYKATENVEEADAILVRSADMHQLAVPNNVKCVARAGAGVNNIPLMELAQQGIPVFNTPGANANGVKELVFAAMLLAARDVVGGINWAAGQVDNANVAKDTEKEKKKFAGYELSGKKLGVIGLGAIGVLVANAAISLGMNVVGYDPMISVDHAWKLSRSIKRENSLDSLMAACDFVTVHVPLKDATRGMIGKRALSLCRKGVRVMNFSRAALVDDDAMIEALGDGRVAAYVTDFPTDKVLGVEGVICIPHLGASTPESEENCAVMAAAQTRDFIEHGIIRNSVNLPAVDVAPVSTPRLLCIHENIPNVLGSITSTVAGFGLNISELVNRSRGAMAVSVIDIDEVPHRMRDALLDKTQEIAGMKRVRLLGV